MSDVPLIPSHSSVATVDFRCSRSAEAAAPYDGTARVTRNDAHANRRHRNWGHALGTVDFGTYPTNDQVSKRIAIDIYRKPSL